MLTGVADSASIHLVVTLAAPAPAPHVGSGAAMLGGIIPAGTSLVRWDGSRVLTTALEGKIVALYFSAHWCPPCRQFTPVLKQFYNEINESNSGEL